MNFTPPLGTQADDVASAVVAAVDEADLVGRLVPVVTTFLGSSSAAAILRSGRRPVPCFTYPETAVRALAHVVSYAQWRARPPGAIPLLDDVDPNEARRRLLRRWRIGLDHRQGRPGGPFHLRHRLRPDRLGGDGGRGGRRGRGQVFRW